MKPRHKRLVLVVAGLALLGGAATLILSAFQDNLVFFRTPSEVAEGNVPRDKTFRIGGLVADGSVKRDADGVTVHFVVTDTVKSIPVVYKGPLPDLFREGKGAVVQGRLSADGSFAASEVLAKHDENYMPPEAQHALDQAHNAERTLKQ
jgi:cytochrome c-type biogenesis protein CcmE